MSRRRGLISVLVVAVFAIVLSVSHGQPRVGATGTIDISGTVVDQNNNGVAGVSVYATDPGTSAVDFGPVMSASDGTFDLQVTAGTYDFHFDPPSGSGFSPVVDSNVTVLNDQVINEQFTLPSYALSGTITDADGSVPADLHYLGLSLAETVGRGGSDNTWGSNPGSYDITAPQGSYDFSISSSNYPGNDLPTRFGFDGGLINLSANTTQNIQFPQVAPLVVSVVDSNGNPVSSQAVTAEAQGSAELFPGSGTTVSGYSSAFSDQGGGIGVETDDTGTATALMFQGFTAAAGSICTTFSNNARVCNADPVPIGADGATVTLTEPAQVAQPMNTFSGVLTDANGNPVQGVSVSLNGANGASATTVADGSFSESVVPGSYTLFVNDTAYGGDGDLPTTFFGLSGGVIDLTGGNATENIQMPPTAELNVVDHDFSGNPVSNSYVTADASGQTTMLVGGNPVQVTGNVEWDGNENTQGVFTDDTGTASFSMFQDFTAPTGKICTDFPVGGNLCTTTPVGIGTGTTVTLTEPQAFTVSGTITDANGNPLPDIGVSLSSTDKRDGSDATTDSSGNYSIVVPADTYDPSISANQYPNTSFPTGFGFGNGAAVDVADTNITQNIQLPPVAAVRVLAEDANGNPVADTYVTFASRGQAAIYTGDSTPASGFTFANDGNGGGVFTDDTGTVSFQSFQDFTAAAGQICAQFPVGGMVCNTRPLPIGDGATLVMQSGSVIVNPPENLTAQSPTTTVPSLSWSVDSEAVSYNIYRNNTLIGSTTSTAYADTTAVPGTTYQYMVTAVNSAGVESLPSYATVTYNAPPTVPVFTSWSNDTEVFGVPFSFTVTTSAAPGTTLKKAGALPPGVTLTDNGDGTATIAGTPKGTANGPYAITITAKNSYGTATQSFTETITKVPVFKSIPKKNLISTVGSPYSLTMTTSAYGTAGLSESGTLPNGLSFTDNGNGTATISGTPLAGDGGTYPITVTAANSYGSAVDSLTITVDELPTITSGSSASATIGMAFSFQVTASGFPAPKYALAGTLPAGLHLSTTSGQITGTPKNSDTPGTYTVTITASNSVGSSTAQAFVLTLSPAS